MTKRCPQIRRCLHWLPGLATLLVTAACSDAPPPTSPEDPAPRPNIIFLVADDQRAGTTSKLGHPHIRTPNLDRLAQAGVTFTNAYSVQPICAPSRFAMLSGQYERTNGLGFNSPYLATEAQWDKTYPALLRDAGYHTGFVGKFGVEFYTFRGATAEKFDFWRAHDGFLSFFVKDNPEGTDISSYTDAASDLSTEIMGEYIDEFLDGAPADKPFNLSVSFSAPHGSITSSMYPDADTTHCTSKQCEKMGTPANLNPRLAGHPIFGALYRDAGIVAPADLDAGPYVHLPEEVVGHRKRQQWYHYLYDKETNPEHTIRYLQLITGIDAVVGRLLDKLAARGLLDNTIIIYTSDHGLLTGEYGVGGKGLLYDLSAKVPLIVVDPRAERGVERDALIVNVDFAPTMLAYAGVAAPPVMQGRDLRPLLRSSEQDWRSEIFIESLTTIEDKTMSEALRTKRWKYIRYFANDKCPYEEADLDFANRQPVFEQLFDLEADPAERTNLAADDSHASVLEQLRERAGARSLQLTKESRDYKQQAMLPPRPSGQGCW